MDKELCVHCKNKIEGEYEKVDWRIYCVDCFKELFTSCEQCGITIPQDEARSGADGGEILCEDCYSEKYDDCCECGDIFLREDLIAVGSRYYCSDCFNDNFFVCDGCGDTYLISQVVELRTGNFCEDCGRRSGIHQYSYKPRPIFHKFSYENTLFMGVELEYNDLNEEVAGAMREIDVKEEKIYFKRDSSISGFEIVSHPMTLLKHKEFNWKEILMIANRGGAKCGGAGLHVHLRKCKPLEFQKLKAFFYSNRDFIFKMSRRNWDSFNYNAKITSPNNTSGALEEVKRGEYWESSRYVAINPRNEDTIEIRIFKATKRQDFFYAALEFCHAIYHFVKTMSIVKFYKNPCLREFVEYVGKDNNYRFLKKYMRDIILTQKSEWSEFAQMLEKKGGKKQCA